MGKRSNFERKPRDFYPTPYEAVVPLLPFLDLPDAGGTFSEPCAGSGDLMRHLESAGAKCLYSGDIATGQDALECGSFPGDFIITNPPWSRAILHDLIEHFRRFKPTWLLIDSDWAYTKQSSDYMKYCAMIVAVGRVKWIPDSKMTGKDNCAWYLFDWQRRETIFIGR